MDSAPPSCSSSSRQPALYHKAACDLPISPKLEGHHPFSTPDICSPFGHRKIDFVWHDRVFLDIHSMAAPPPPPKGGGLSLYANLLNPKADAQATVSGAPVVYDNGKKEDAAVKKEVSQGKQRLHTDFHIRREAPSRIAILATL